MKRDRIWICVTAVLAAVMAFVPGGSGGILWALALPFTALGWVLRTLSLSGPIGNTVSILLYALICLLPLVFLWRSRRRTEDWLLLLLPLMLAVVLYYMVNPNLRSPLLQDEVGDLIYSFSVWVLLATWGVLKLLYSGKWVLENNIYRALRVFLLLCASSCLISGLGVGTANLIYQIKNYTGNIAPYFDQAPFTIPFLLLDYLAELVEGALTALVLYKGVHLLYRLEADPFGEECVNAAEDVSRWCRRTLAVSCLVSLFLNLGLLLTADLVMNLSVELRFPVFGMAVAFAILAVTKLLVRGKELKDETDLFI